MKLMDSNSKGSINRFTANVRDIDDGARKVDRREVTTGGEI